MIPEPVILIVLAILVAWAVFGTGAALGLACFRFGIDGELPFPNCHAANTSAVTIPSPRIASTIAFRSTRRSRRGLARLRRGRSATSSSALGTRKRELYSSR